MVMVRRIRGYRGPAAELSAQQLSVLRHLFYAEGYSSVAGLDAELDHEAIFAHYLKHGLPQDLAPSPFFDVEICRSRMEGPAAGVITAWLQHGMREGVVPTGFFDKAEYLKMYADVAAAGVDPFLHYVEHGRFEGRFPSRKLEGLIRSLAERNELGNDALWRALSRLGESGPAAELSAEQLSVLRHLFYAEGYSSFAGLDADLDHEAIFAHYLKHGLPEDLAPGPFFDVEFCRSRMEGPAAGVISAWLQHGMREGIVPTGFFDKAEYLKMYADVAAAGIDPFLHYVEHGRFEGRFPSRKLEGLIRSIAERNELGNDALWRALSRLGESGPAAELSAHQLSVLRHLFYAEGYSSVAGLDAELDHDAIFAHYLKHGLPEDLAPGPFFDVEICRSRMEGPAAGVISAWLQHGMREGIVPTEFFDKAEYLKMYDDVAAAGIDPFLHYVEHGRFEGRFPSRKLEGLVRSLAERNELGNDGLWRALSLLGEKLARLYSPKMKALIAHAASIEPMVMHPRTAGAVSGPPHVHANLPLLHAGRIIRSSVPKAHYDRIVLVPHCRTAGSARVAGELTQHLLASDPTKSLLLVLTDGSFFERPEWFGSSYDRFDLAAILQQEKVFDLRLLLDLIRGLRPEMIFNVNSRLAWDMTARYGRQLATETKMFAYLFTWELDEWGNKEGYPIEHFQLGFDHLTRVLVDSAALKRELSSRYAMSPTLQDKLRVLYTPAQHVRSNYSENFQSRRMAGFPMRCFWSGRLDLQKRFDVVIQIAQQRPDLEICAWGKPVIGDSSLDMTNLPSNIKMMGTYRDFEELPIRSFDFFLYTSAWDGLPTILLDCGSRGIPVIASRVGGVGEVIDESTGWPIDDVLNPAAYLQAIESMAKNPSEVSLRAAALLQRVKTMFNSRLYRDHLISAIKDPT